MEPRIEIKTKIGTLVAEATADPEHPGIVVTLKRADGIEIDLFTAEFEDVDYLKGVGENSTEDIIAGFIWGDADSEEWTHKFVWPNGKLNQDFDSQPFEKGDTVLIIGGCFMNIGITDVVEETYAEPNNKGQMTVLLKTIGLYDVSNIKKV